MSVENDFLRLLIESFPNLNKKNIVRQTSNRYDTHLRFKPDCGISTVEEMVGLIKKLKLEFAPGCYSGSPDYRDHGITVDWDGRKIGMMLAVQKNGRVKRKELSPKNLGLSGSKFSSSAQFESAIKQAVEHHAHSDFLVSLIDNVKSGVSVLSQDAIRKEDISRITSDFGEVLAAFASVCKGKTVLFPKTSNHTVADFIENGVPVSAKNPRGGGKVNLSTYRDLIDTSTDVGKLLFSIADHNKNDFFKYAAAVSPLIKNIADMVGGTDINSVKIFVRKTPYSVFYNWIRSNPECKMLGIPDSGRPEELWKQGSTEPFYFTVNTLLNRIWGQDSTNGITEMVAAFLNKPKFVKVDIVNNQVVFEEIKFKNIKYWGTCYWSRATAAWHNWMAVEPLKETK